MLCRVCFPEFLDKKKSFKLNVHNVRYGTRFFTYIKVCTQLQNLPLFICLKNCQCKP